MTAVRKSYLIAREQGFATGIPEVDSNNVEKWYPMPQGFYMSWNGSTQATSLYGTGAKTRQNSIYGVFQGSWNASFVMDFNNLEFLSILFDQEDNVPNLNTTEEDNNKDKCNFLVPGKNNVYEHVFRKVNNRRPTSYVIKEVVLNIIAGGQFDETNIIKGVVARNIQGARSTSGSQMAIEMSGVFADYHTVLSPTPLDSLFTPVNDPLTQYSCMYMGANNDLQDGDAVEQVDSHSFNIETNISLVFTTCKRIATNYFEDKSTFSWNATAYMNDPTKKFKLLSNSGGTVNPKVNNPTDPLARSLVYRDPLNHSHDRALQPMGKNLAPLEYVNFITYDESMRDLYNQPYDSVVEAFDNSEHIIWVRAINSTVKTTSTPKGDGSKLQDSLSSVECDEIVIRVRNNIQTVWNDGLRYDVRKSPQVATATFEQTAIENVTEAFQFPLPVAGYMGAILEDVYIPVSVNAVDMTLENLAGYVVITKVDMKDTSQTYVLDNIIPKQLTNAGQQPVGELVVGTAKVTVDGNDVLYPKITGTPNVIRTDYYFIVKKDTSAGTKSGYLRVAVR